MASFAWRRFVVTALLLAAAPVRAATIFPDGFESGGVCGGWSQVVGTDDANCAGAGWQVTEWFSETAWAPCATVNIHGLVPGDRLLLTMCSPAGGGVGDPIASNITDDQAHVYSAATNDDCLAGGQVPQLLGWSCLNDSSELKLFCAPEDGAGIEFLGTERLDLTVCGFNSSSGHARLYIWDNGTSVPNPG